MRLIQRQHDTWTMWDNRVIYVDLTARVVSKQVGLVKQVQQCQSKENSLFINTQTTPMSHVYAIASWYHGGGLTKASESMSVI
jgi:hypothetical protein